MKHPNRPSIGKHDIVRAMNSLNIRLSACEAKVQDLDVLLMEFVEFLGKQKDFEKYLDGKYKQEEREPSGGDSANGKE
tara:strand:- start:338 stop:571 length:234 start_codon:yes stop_codon:yes gene_type:complete